MVKARSRESQVKVKARSKRSQGKVKATQTQPQPQLQFDGFWHKWNQPSSTLLPLFFYTSSPLFCIWYSVIDARMWLNIPTCTNTLTYTNIIRNEKNRIIKFCSASSWATIMNEFLYPGIVYGAISSKLYRELVREIQNWSSNPQFWFCLPCGLSV